MWVCDILHGKCGGAWFVDPAKDFYIKRGVSNLLTEVTQLLLRHSCWMWEKFKPFRGSCDLAISSVRETGLHKWISIQIILRNVSKCLGKRCQYLSQQCMRNCHCEVSLKSCSRSNEEPCLRLYIPKILINISSLLNTQHTWRLLSLENIISCDFNSSCSTGSAKSSLRNNIIINNKNPGICTLAKAKRWCKHETKCTRVPKDLSFAKGVCVFLSHAYKLKQHNFYIICQSLSDLQSVQMYHKKGMKHRCTCWSSG